MANPHLMDSAVEMAFDYTSDAIFLLSEERTILHLNRAAEELTGWRRDDLVGHFCGDLFQCQDASGCDFCGAGCWALRVFADGEPLTYAESRIKTRSGDFVEISSSYGLTPYDAEGRRHAVLVMRDISEKRRMERELHRMQTNLLQETRERERRAELLAEIGRRLLSTEHLAENYEPALQAVGELLRSNRADWQVDPPTSRLLNRASAYGSLAFSEPPAPPARVLAAPLTIWGETIGSLWAAWDQPKAEPDPEAQVLLNHIAALASLALENLALYARVEDRAVEEERRRLAREIHDGAAQVLAFLKLKTAELQLGLSGLSEAELESRLREIRKVLGEASQDLRYAINDLDRIDMPDGVLGALHDYLDHFAAQSGLEVLVSAPPLVDPRLSRQTELQVIRIMQEALTNVRKHARARQVSISIEELDGRWQFTVADDGQGFSPEGIARDRGHFGLQTMRERAALIGATIAIESAPGAGTTIRLQLPGAER